MEEVGDEVLTTSIEVEAVEETTSIEEVCHVEDTETEDSNKRNVTSTESKTVS